MKKSPKGIKSKLLIPAWMMNALLFLFIVPVVWADDYAQLEGFWQCQEEGVSATLEFQSRQQLLYNGQAYHYQLAPGTLQVQEPSGLVNYFFRIDGGILSILSPDGSVTRCQKARKPQLAAPGQQPGMPTAPYPQTQSAGQHWPPPYARPQGRIDENNPSAQALLYKFAGRWDHVTSNTLNNLFLKPDGTYEEAYEAGYSGVFQDQGGYQTGHWGATGTQGGRGYWKVVGSLRQGKLYLVDQNGRERVYNYEVHIRRGEVYWGEYFFNRRLYSVKYIYR